MSNEIAPSDAFEAQLSVQMRHAEVMSKADMLPDKFKNKPANVLVAQELAQAMGESPWVTMSELYFVGNIPTFSAKYMRSRVRAAGHILREAFDPATMTATCTIIRNDDPGYEHIVKWDKAKAEAHGLWGKGHWKKNPQLMLRNRAVSENVRAACNEVMGGVSYTADEAQAMQSTVSMSARREDIAAQAAAAIAPPSVNETPSRDWHAELAAVTDGDQLQALMTEAHAALGEEEYAALADAANTKYYELNGAE